MRRLVVPALAAIAVVLGLAVPASATPQPPEPLEYVALGDSYSAASGVLPLDPTASPLCLRSTRNYPHVLAARLGARLTDVTCGAAETTHFRTAQYPGVAPQLDALDAGTDLVTMTIGGNDSSVFIGAILACGVAGTASLGLGSPCADQYGSSFTDTVEGTTYPALVQALRDVRAAAPHARVVIVGYPWILPAAGGCFPLMPVARGDVPYLRNLQATLNGAIERAARRTGATYVDMSRVSEGRDACRPIGVRWVEPVLVGTNPVIVHPNALGEQAIAEQVARALPGR
ncbi:SGNH/GDSL hydrolase family protein [Trujillonella endophytica]|uniref:GDSL-like Lipase/Acylhydrolase family protein n=1 Tax=Trujillonella endophytica TaxID=673521 RepID=A0A1H8Q0X8_9ACTN|nr:SGNH/GDSL hydrolase family protein [Trujillella endophytica]SEO47879.1 GDSL-like Lipase/Acylhydrolase family protein [Trujillella endophytica]